MADGKPLGWGFAEGQALLEPPTDELSELRSYAPKRKQPILLASQQEAIDADAQKFGESEFEELRSYSPLGAKVKAHTKQAASTAAQVLTGGFVTQPFGKLPAILGTQASRGIVGGLNALGVTDKTAADVSSAEEAPLYRAANAIEGGVRDVLPPQRGYEQSVPAQIVGGLASLPPALAFGVAGGGAGLFASSAIQNGVAAYEEAGIEGASEGDRDRAFWVNAIAGGALDAIPAERLISGFKRIKAAGGKDWAKLARESTIQSGVESGTEFLQQGIADLNARYSYDPDRGWEEIGERALHSGAIGGAVGLISGAGVGAAGRIAGGQAQAPSQTHPELDELRAAAPAVQPQAAPTDAPPIDHRSPTAPRINLTGTDPRSIQEQEAALLRQLEEGTLDPQIVAAELGQLNRGALEQRREASEQDYRSEVYSRAADERAATPHGDAEALLTDLRQKIPNPPSEQEIAAEVARMEAEGLSPAQAFDQILARGRAFTASQSPAAAPLQPEPISGNAAQTPFAPTGEGGAAAASQQGAQTGPASVGLSPTPGITPTTTRAELSTPSKPLAPEGPEAAARATQEEDAYFAKFQADTGVAVKRVRPKGDPNITELEERAEQSGARLVWFDPEGGRVPAGAHMTKGLIFLDVTRPAQARRYVLHHELWHELEKRFPDIAKRISEAMRRADPQAFAKRGADYLKSFEGSGIQIAPEQVESESAAVTVQDFGGFMDAALRTPEALQAAIEKHPGLWKSIADALLKVLRKLGVYKGKTFAHRARLKALSEFAETAYERGGIKPNVAAQLALEIKQAFDLLTEEEAAPSEAAKAQQPGEFAEPGRYAAPSPQKTDSLGFFSQLERTIEQKLPARASSKQVLDVAKGGAKAEELEYSGLAQFLEGKGSVKKEDVLAFLRENNVSVQEVKLGETDAVARMFELESKPEGSLSADETAELESIHAGEYGPRGKTKFQNYQLPGGENYRELLLTLPARGGEGKALGRWSEITARLDEIASLPASETDPKTARGKEYLAEHDSLVSERKGLRIPHARDSFKGGHFDEPNVLAHVRFNERTDSEGRRVLFLEEVQSDWHQKGRKQGYAGRPEEPAPLSNVENARLTQRVDPNETRLEMTREMDRARADFTPEERASIARYLTWYHAQPIPGSGVPDAPFKTSWHELALKRMLRYAADQGFDSIAWTTGEQQAERYDLSKQISRVEYMPDLHRLVAYDLDGSLVIEEDTPPDKIEDYVGKDVAARLLSSEISTGSGRQVHSVEGEGLKVGGEGMRGFYDQILVRAANKLAKRWGGRVEKAQVQTAPDSMMSGYTEAEKKASKFRPAVHSLVIPDAMRADVREEGFPRYAAPPAVSGTGERQGFDVPDETRWRRLYTGLVHDLGRIEQIEEAAPTKVAGGESVKQALALAPGRRYGETEKLRARFLRPLTAQLKRSGVDAIESKPGLPSASDYIYALHAPQANAVAKERHPRKFGAEATPGSGMRDSEAARLVAEAQASPQAETYKWLQAWNRKLNVKRLDTLESGGLISKEEREAWVETYGPDYVPLRTAPEDPTTKALGFSAGFGVSGKEAKRREGRTSKADSPLVFGLATAETAIERKERNRIGNLIGDLARKNPGDFWGVFEDANKIPEGWERLSFKENGEQRWIGTSDKALSEAFKRLQSPDPGVLKVLDPVLSYLRRVIIDWNPVFPLTNVPRDIGTATVKGLISGDYKQARLALTKALPAAKGAFRAIRDENAKGHWEDTYRAARKAGALIGWSESFDYHERVKEFEAAVQPETKARAFGRLVEDLNRSTELGTRLATFDALLKEGKSEREAAIGARKVTADFARRGRWAPVYRRLYLFSGANIQGNAEIASTLSKNPRRAAFVLGSLVGAGYGLAVLSMALGDEDELAKLTEDDKARFFGVMVGKRRYGIPAAYGFNVFPYLGWKLAEASFGKAKPGKATADVLSSTLDSFSPLPRGATALQVATPTVARPFVEIGQNVDFAGRPIEPQEDPFARAPKPHAERSFQGVSPAAKGIAKGLARATGGDEVSPGMVDISPEWIEHMAKAATGGLGTFAGRSAEVMRKIATGDTEDLRVSDIPFLRPFVQEAARGADTRRYYETLGELEEAQKREKAELSLSKEQRKILELGSDFKSAEKELRSLREERDEVKSDAAKKRIEREIRAVQARLVREAK